MNWGGLLQKSRRHKIKNILFRWLLLLLLNSCPRLAWTVLVTDSKNCTIEVFVSTYQYQKAMHHHHILIKTASCSLHAVNHLKYKLLYLVQLYCWIAGCWCPFCKCFPYWYVSYLMPMTGLLEYHPPYGTG